MARKDGIIALQIHAGPPMKVQFRNVRLKLFPKEVEAGRKKIVFIAGNPSHGYAQHEHRAGCLLLAKCLNESMPNVAAVVCEQGWPSAETLADAATIVVYADGGGAHPIMAHRDEIEKLMQKGVGLACIHYAVEVPADKLGAQFKRWIGGHFETFWSVNPEWKAVYQQLPNHPVANGVRPFAIVDEWYYHMRFTDDAKGLTPILTATPPDSTRRAENSAYGGILTSAPHGHAGNHGLGLSAAGRRPRLRLHRRPLALELGLRQLPQGGAQRHRLDGRPGRARRRRRLEDADPRGTRSESGQAAAARFRPPVRVENAFHLPQGTRR